MLILVQIILRKPFGECGYQFKIYRQTEFHETNIKNSERMGSIIFNCIKREK